MKIIVLKENIKGFVLYVCQELFQILHTHLYLWKYIDSGRTYPVKENVLPKHEGIYLFWTNQRWLC